MVLFEVCLYSLSSIYQSRLSSHQLDAGKQSVWRAKNIEINGAHICPITSSTPTPDKLLPVFPRGKSLSDNSQWCVRLPSHQL